MTVRRAKALLSLLGLAALLSCDSPQISWLWKTFEHPTYRFTVRVPRGWTIKRDGLLGSAVAFLASDEDPLYRANANIVVELWKDNKSLDTLADQAVQHLTFLMNDYELLSRAPTRLGNLRAIELRGRYRGPEGLRILRTVIGLSEDTYYIA
ncbi:MAG TPA: hypothetical protein VI895_06565, partial [Bdellovibrionota bacterium]|nr:hypothetical protein [Bdellovibrionota bacterium]